MPTTITNVEFNTFLKAVKLTVSGTDYTVPIWDMRVKTIPFSGGVGPAVELADGGRKQDVRKWHIQVDLSVEFGIDESKNCDSTTAIHNALQATNFTLDLDPTDNPGTRVLTVVIKDATDFLQTQFTGKVRNRAFRVSFITETPYDTGSIPSWIAGD